MTTAQQYIDGVVDLMPRGAPMRTQIAMELEAHIAERVAHGFALDEVLHQLGDPVKLADSYLAAEPLVAAPFGDRATAKLIDTFVVLLVVGPLAAVSTSLTPGPPVVTAIVLFLAFCGSALLGLYTIVAEYETAQTLGKRVCGLRVVHESGRRISVGQAIVRQLPLVLSVFFIDALFALFTDKSQRAFEMLSKTRVVLALPQETQ
jgi:uncharacterized RDD family membrane protein YckC